MHGIEDLAFALVGYSVFYIPLYPTYGAVTRAFRVDSLRELIMVGQNRDLWDYVIYRIDCCKNDLRIATVFRY